MTYPLPPGGGHFNIMSENNYNIRTPLRAGIRLTHPILGELLLKTRDISQSGAFVIYEENDDLKIGDTVTIQSTDIDDAPVIDAEIVRIEASGFAVHYLVD